MSNIITHGKEGKWRLKIRETHSTIEHVTNDMKHDYNRGCETKWVLGTRAL